MGFNAKLKSGAFATTSTGIAGASGTVVTGSSVPMIDVQQDTLTALVTLTVETNTVTLVPSWQVSNDGSTWYDVQGSAGSTRTGTGSTATYSEVLKLGTVCWRYARVKVTVGVTTAVNTKEFYAVSYTYKSPDFY